MSSKRGKDGKRNYERSPREKRFKNSRQKMRIVCRFGTVNGLLFQKRNATNDENDTRSGERSIRSKGKADRTDYAKYAGTVKV